MKIIYIALKYDYGIPEQGFSFEHYNFYDTLVQMNNNEHTIIYFPFDEILLKKGKKIMNADLIKLVEKEKPDLCFFFLFTNEIQKNTIQKITKDLGVTTFNWFADDHWRFDTFSRYYAPCFSYVGTTDQHTIERYLKIGYRNVIKTQWACNHFLYKPQSLQKNIDVSFVGRSHGDRKKIVENLKKNGITVTTRGAGWEGGRVSQEEMINIFSRSKINLNFSNASVVHSSITSFLKSIVRIFISRGINNSIYIHYPGVWRKRAQLVFRKRTDQIKGRNFEIPGSGGFLLTNSTLGLEEYYKDGEDIVTFKNIVDLKEKISYYLSHNEEREEIAKNGYLRTINEHTYEKRFNEVFKHMKL